MKLKVDLARLEEPLCLPHYPGDSSFGSLVRWLRYVFDTTLANIEWDMGLGQTMLHKNMKVRKQSLKGETPQLFRSWLFRHAGYRIKPADVQKLSVQKGEEWQSHAVKIRRVLRKRSAV